MDKIKKKKFRDNSKIFIRSMKKSLSELPDGISNEAAIPAYCHPNPLIRSLFWQRIRIVFREISNQKVKNSLDFGCGTGVLLPLLAEFSDNVVGYDINTAPINILEKHINFPENIQILNGKINPLDQIEEKFDLITSLDVLEHIPDPGKVIDNFLNLLKHRGRVIISVPTENILYKMGRKIAGSRFSGEYHEHDAKYILNIAYQKGKVEIISNLCSLFTIFILQKR
jgi:2-polyprenyl-3-methyl-5-hydroxy-6-metoxy-1,4-benzoquinol methylase